MWTCAEHAQVLVHIHGLPHAFADRDDQHSFDIVATPVCAHAAMFIFAQAWMDGTGMDPNRVPQP